MNNIHENRISASGPLDAATPSARSSERRKKEGKRWPIFLPLVFALFLSACGQLSATVEGEKLNYAIKYNLKINPEFEIYADEELNVLAALPLNEDAEAVLQNLELEGISVTDAVNSITEESKVRGFMTEEKENTVLLTIEEKAEDIETCHLCSGSGTVLCWDCSGTAHVDCGICEGAGETICVTCRGSGTRICEGCLGNPYACPECAGAGWITCRNCGGTGFIDNNCFNCGGTGKCPDCGGSGSVVVTAGDTGNVVYISPGVPEMGGCQGCHGTGICQVCSDTPFCPSCTEHWSADGIHRNPGGIPGKDRCPICEGGFYLCLECRGETLSCVDCEGRGKDPCVGCHGSGKLPCGCELNGYRWCPCCWGSGVEGTGDPNYDPSMTAEAYFNATH